MLLYRKAFKNNPYDIPLPVHLHQPDRMLQLDDFIFPVFVHVDTFVNGHLNIRQIVGVGKEIQQLVVFKYQGRIASEIVVIHGKDKVEVVGVFREKPGKVASVIFAFHTEEGIRLQKIGYYLCAFRL